MLNKIVDILIGSPSTTIEGYLLLCQHTITDKQFIQTLSDGSFIENTFTEDLQDGDELTLEFSLPRLASIGFYKDWTTFLKQNYYKYPIAECYSFEDKLYLADDVEFNKKYKAIISLMDSILKLLSTSMKKKINIMLLYCVKI